MEEEKKDLSFAINKVKAIDMIKNIEFGTEGVGKILFSQYYVDLESNLYKTCIFRKKIGTTIVGLRFDDGLILGADSRTIVGKEVDDHRTLKIYKLKENIYLCGSGYGKICETLFGHKHQAKGN